MKISNEVFEILRNAAIQTWQRRRRNDNSDYINDKIIQVRKITNSEDSWVTIFGMLDEEGHMLMGENTRVYLEGMLIEINEAASFARGAKCSQHFDFAIDYESVGE